MIVKTVGYFITRYDWYAAVFMFIYSKINLIFVDTFS